MIIVSIEIPVMEVSYDFQIDEDIPVAVVRNEIAEMVGQKNKCSINGSIDDLMLWDKRSRRVLDLNRTGFENGLETGSELVMV